MIISFNLFFFLFRRLPSAFAIFSGIGENENASAFSQLMTFLDWTENDVKALRMYLLTSADFVFLHILVGLD